MNEVQGISIHLGIHTLQKNAMVSMVTLHSRCHLRLNNNTDTARGNSPSWIMFRLLIQHSCSEKDVINRSKYSSIRITPTAQPRIDNVTIL